MYKGMDECLIPPYVSTMANMAPDENSLSQTDYSTKPGSQAIQTEHSVSPTESYVLSCFEKSNWTFFARLAIIKARHACISINATSPPIFLGSIISRVNAKIMPTLSTCQISLLWCRLSFRKNIQQRKA